MDINMLKSKLPAFPRTAHLPHKPNASEDDIVAEAFEVSVVFQCPVHVEEKIDGASMGMTLFDGYPVLRNRDHILKKGYLKDTPAKKQFVPAWNWFYKYQDRFRQLEGYSVYGEWMWARHGIYYDRLPDWFIAYDVFDQNTGQFIEPILARKMLCDAGFAVPFVRYIGEIDDYGHLEAMANQMSPWAENDSEGIYLKLDDGKQVTHHFKMVRKDFIRGRFWDGKKMMRNAIIGS